MEQKTTTTTTIKKRSLPAKIGRGVGIFFLSLILLIVLILLLIQTAPVQNFGRKKIVAFLENKLKTEVQIKRLDIDFPKMLVLEGVYIEDQKKDTLIAGNQLKVDIDMFKLIKGEIQINEINLNGITAKIKRELPDKKFNYQFIVDAFATEEKKPKTDTAALKMAINKIIVDKTRLVYYDVVTGNDVDVYLGHFDTRIDTFDPTNLKYDVPSIVLTGVRGRVNQTKPMEVTAVATNPDSTVKNEAPQFLLFTNKEMLVKDIDFSYNNAISAMSTRIAFKDLTIHPEKFDLKNSAVAIKDIELNNLDGFLSMGKGQETDVVKLTTETGREVNAEALPWKITIGAIRLNNNKFAFDDNTKPRISRGMDYAHLGLQDLTLHAENFLMHNDTIATNITKGSMRERSGFVLNNFQTDVTYTNTGAALENILIQTPGSEIKKSFLVRYPSLAALQKDMSTLQLNVNLENSYIQVKDILTFVPALASQPAFRNPSARLFVNSQVSGNMNRLLIDEFQFRGLGNTNVDISGVIGNAMDPKKVNADLSIRRFTTSRSDIVSLTPPGTIPKNITIPEAISLTGVVRGGMQNAFADLSLNTSLGSARVNGRVTNPTDKINARYDADISASGLNVGAITQQQQNIGTISARFKVNGRGYDPDRTYATVKGTVTSAEVMKYNYRNLNLDAAIAGQKFNAKAAIRDPNIHLALNAEGNMGGNLPGFVINADIDSIKTLPLHLTPDPIYYRGKITANVPEFNMDALNGEVNVVNSVLVMNNQRIMMDSVTLTARHQNNEQIIGLKTDFATAEIQGAYKIAQLGDIFIEAIQPYYAINPTGKLKAVDPYNFTINAAVFDHPTLHGFVPDLKRFDGMTLKSSFSSSDGVNADLIMPYVLYGTNAIDSVRLNAATSNNTLTVTTNINKFSSGTSLSLYKTSLITSLSNNKIAFGLSIKDKLARSKYRLAGILAQEPNSVYSFALRPDSLMLNYDTWSINSDNLIRFGKTIVNANNFNLSKGDQHLIINSLNTSPNSPLAVDFQNFQIGTLTAFVQSDSLPVDGTLNGNIQVRDVLKQPNFVTDLNLNNLAFKKDTIGDVNIKVNNNTQNVFATNITITGRGNDVGLTGNYYLKPANASSFDFILNIRQLPFRTIEGVSMGSIKNSSGNLTGTVAINGTAAKPNIDGGITFNQTQFTPTMLGSQFRIDGETIKVNNQGIRFDTFTIKDSANNSLVIDGLAGTSNFTNYNFGLTVKARNFRAINSVKQQGSLYYGQLYFNTNLNIKGTEAAPSIDGSFRVNDNTNLSIVLPQAEPGLVERQGVIEFVDMDAPGNDSIFQAKLKSYDSSFNKTAVTGMDVAVNVEVVKEAIFNVIVDEANGDFLQLKGAAALTGGIDPSGKITMTGTYEIESGGYELSFNFIHRKFEIQKGSKITWTGEPTTGDIDVTAVYIANTSPADLVTQIDESSRGYYQQKMPFNVKLNVKGQMMSPQLTFDIDLPKENNVRVNNDVLTTVNTRLAQIRQEPSELNKQVFALLLLNRFVGENPFQSSGTGGGFSAGSFARQSVSKILTEQLNNLASDLIGGVEISFDVNSADDYSTGSRRDRTDFNVALSKRLLSDRLKVTVGSNYELEGPQKANQQSSGSNVIGNVSVDYMLSQDGRYLLRGYRKNDYDAVVEGQVIETGLRFIITADYNKFKELLQNRKRRRELRKQNQEQEKLNDKKQEKLNDKATTGNTPVQDQDSSVVFTDKIVADNRINIPVTENDSTDGNK